jgi:hypothetical protein
MQRLGQGHADIEGPEIVVAVGRRRVRIAHRRRQIEIGHDAAAEHREALAFARVPVVAGAEARARADGGRAAAGAHRRLGSVRAAQAESREHVARIVVAPGVLGDLAALADLALGARDRAVRVADVELERTVVTAVDRARRLAEARQRRTVVVVVAWIRRATQRRGEAERSEDRQRP